MIPRLWAQVDVDRKQEVVGGRGPRFWLRCWGGGWPLPIRRIQGRSRFGGERMSLFWSHTEFGGLWVSMGASSTWVWDQQEAPSWVRAQVGGQQGLGWNQSKQQRGFLRTLVPSIQRERKAGSPP